MLRVLLFAMLVLGLAGCPKPRVALWDTKKPSVRATPATAALEREMFQRLNQDRAKAGLPKLTYDEDLADVARAHSHDMQIHDFFAHESPQTGVLEDRMDRAGYLAAEMRENLAKAPNVQEGEDNLLESPGHKRNILADTISHIGIGIVRGDASGDERVLLITQVFAKRAVLVTPEQAVSGVLSVLNAARKKAGLGPLVSHPMLAELADEQMADLPDDVSSSAVSDVGSAVAEVLNDRDGHGLVSVQILGQAIFSPEEFTVSGAILDRSSTKIGIAAGRATDERGRPRVKVLALVGQQ